MPVTKWGSPAVERPQRRGGYCSQRSETRVFSYLSTSLLLFIFYTQSWQVHTWETRVSQAAAKPIPTDIPVTLITWGWHKHWWIMFCCFTSNFHCENINIHYSLLWPKTLLPALSAPDGHRKQCWLNSVLKSRSGITSDGKKHKLIERHWDKIFSYWLPTRWIFCI